MNEKIKQLLDKVKNRKTKGGKSDPDKASGKIENALRGALFLPSVSKIKDGLKKIGKE